MTDPCPCVEHYNPRTGRLEQVDSCERHQPGRAEPLAAAERKKLNDILNQGAVAMAGWLAAHHLPQPPWVCTDQECHCDFKAR